MTSTQQIIELLTKVTAILEKKSSFSNNAASEVILSIVPLVGIIFGTVAIFFFMYWRYRLRRELIRSGQFTPTSNKILRTWSLLMGCLSTFVGIPMVILFFIMEGASYSALGGLIPLCVGLGFLLFYLLSKEKSE